nr:MAG TPA: hypothetical protein [Bacteriophage sp.]
MFLVVNTKFYFIYIIYILAICVFNIIYIFIIYCIGYIYIYIFMLNIPYCLLFNITQYKVFLKTVTENRCLYGV